jgi:hypothetical protein
VIKSLLRTWVRGNVYRKGLSGSSPFWTAVALIGALRWMRDRFSHRDDPPVFAEALRSGERVELVRRGAPDRSLRRDRGRELRLLRQVERRLASPRRRTRRAAAARVAGTRLKAMVDAELLGRARGSRRDERAIRGGRR